MNKFKSKKGFTLAELLIVVAIIAVLVAIAVPLFVGALDKAQKGVMDANKRAVRGAAVEAILMDEKYQKKTEDSGAVTVYTKWTAKAIITSNGEVKALEITCNETATKEESRKATTADKIGNPEVTATTDDYFVVINITELTATPPKA